MNRVAYFLMLAAACGAAETAAHAETDFFESRPEKCREATARIVESTGGTFKAGKIDDIVEIGNDPPIIAKIDCGTSDDTISVTVDADVKYPPNDWFAAAARAGHGLTGDPVSDIEKSMRNRLVGAMKTPGGYNEADLPKTHFKCYQTASPWVVIEFE